MSPSEVQDLCRGICATAKRVRADLAQGYPAIPSRRRWLAQCGVCLAVAAGAAPARSAGAGTTAATLAGHWRPLGDGLWWLPVASPPPGEADAANRGWLHHLLLAREGAGAGGRWWLCGSGPSPAFGDDLARSVALRFDGARVTDVINARAQPEAVMGNAAFDGARLWALPAVAAEMRRRCPSCVERLRERLGPAGDTLTLAAIRVPTQAVAAGGAALGPFDAWALPRAADAQTLVLRHRASRLWWVDGWLWPGAPPDLRDGDPASVTRGLGELAARIRRRDGAGARVLGGQGPVATPAALADHGRYLADLRVAVRAAMDRGDAEGAAAADAARAMPPRHAAAIAADTLRHTLNWQRMWRAEQDALFR